MFISETSPAVLCMYNFVFKSFFMNYYISNSFLPARVAANSGWFVLPVGLYFRLVCASGWFVRMENNNCTANTSNYD